MNHWANMLAVLPAGGQRLIARSQRISLPRGANATERHARLRHALCHAATVRATYLALDSAVQAALQDLRTRRGGARPADLEQRYGPVRSWRQLAADPRPRTIAERLVLLGWLIFRPATPHHPAHYLLPPELRRWLPRPLAVTTHGPAPAPEIPAAIRATTTMLLACAEQPLHTRADGTLRRSELLRLAARLAPLPEPEAIALVRFVLPLFVDCGLVSSHAGVCRLAPAAQQFLACSVAERLDRLCQAWLCASSPDTWPAGSLIDTTGIDWPLLRRRLCAWACALPESQLLDPATLYPALAASLGPLADTHTHGFRTVDRAPWQPPRAAAVFLGALRGPLRWLGFVAWDREQHVFRTTAPSSAQAPACHTAPGWAYGPPGVLCVPHACANAALLRLQPYARWAAADSATLTLELSRRTLTEAARQGWSTATLWAILEQEAGPPPPEWRAAVDTLQPAVRIQSQMAVLTAPPAALARARQARSVRRYLTTQLAPGVALVRPEHIASLQRALARQQIACTGDAPRPNAAAVAPHSAPRGTSRDGRSSAPAVQHPGDWAALLVACMFYRRHAPPEAPLIPHADLEARLAAQLPPALRQATETALAALEPQADLAEESAPAQPLPLAEAVRQLSAAQERRQAVTILYNAADKGAWTRRMVRPLAVEQRGSTWYLRAYCMARSAERTFRVDRIGGVSPP